MVHTHLGRRRRRLRSKSGEREEAPTGKETLEGKARDGLGMEWAEPRGLVLKRRSRGRRRRGGRGPTERERPETVEWKEGVVLPASWVGSVGPPSIAFPRLFKGTLACNFFF